MKKYKFIVYDNVNQEVIKDAVAEFGPEGDLVGVGIPILSETPSFDDEPYMYYDNDGRFEATLVTNQSH